MTQKTEIASSAPSKLPLRPEPPKGLPKDASRIWRAIVADYPPKHFSGANLVLLENFVRARAFAAECDKAIAKHGLLIDGKANPVVAMRAAAWGEQRACATKLRLAISSLQRADSAKARPNGANQLRKPWEMT